MAAPTAVRTWRANVRSTEFDTKASFRDRSAPRRVGVPSGLSALLRSVAPGSISVAQDPCYHTSRVDSMRLECTGPAPVSVQRRQRVPRRPPTLAGHLAAVPAGLGAVEPGGAGVEERLDQGELAC